MSQWLGLAPKHLQRDVDRRGRSKPSPGQRISADLIQDIQLTPKSMFLGAVETCPCLAPSNSNYSSLRPSVRPRDPEISGRGPGRLESAFKLNSALWIRESPITVCGRRPLLSSITTTSSFLVNCSVTRPLHANSTFVSSYGRSTIDGCARAGIITPSYRTPEARGHQEADLPGPFRIAYFI